MTPSLLLLHGFTGSPESWAPVIRLLPAGTRVVAPALAGHAGALGDDAPDFEREVDRLAGFVPAGPVHVAGYSLGARLALGLLVRHGSLFGGATLVGVHPGLPTEAERAARRREDAELERLLIEQGVEAFVDEWERRPLFATQ